MSDSYKPGEWLAICDRCGFRYLASELRKEWTNRMVCCSCFEVRHPQTLIKVPEEVISTVWSRPEPTDTFVVVPYIAANIGHQT